MHWVTHAAATHVVVDNAGNVQVQRCCKTDKGSGCSVQCVADLSR